MSISTIELSPILRSFRKSICLILIPLDLDPPIKLGFDVGVELGVELEVELEVETSKYWL